MPWPSEDVSKERKLSDQYGVTVAKSIWSRFSLGLTMWGWTNADWFQVMTLYAQGMQSSAPYRDWFMLPTTDKTGQTDRDVIAQEQLRKAYTNIDYTIRSLAPKFTGVIKSKLSQSDYRVKVFSRDPQAIKDKAMKKGELYVNSKFANKWRQSLGVRPKQLDWQPQDRQQLDLYDKMNGFALPLEAGLQQLVNHGYDIGSWNRVRLSQMERLIEHGAVCGKVCYNTDGAVTFQYIHPAMFVCENQDTDLQNEPSFAGHIEKRKIKDIAPRLLDMGFTMNQIRGIAQKYLTYQPTGLVPTGNFNFDFKDPVTARYIWEDFSIDVLCFQ